MDGTCPPMSHALPTLMLESLFGITKTSLEAKVEMSDQPIEARWDAQPKVEFGGHTIEEGKVGPEEEAPLPLQGSIELSLEVESTSKGGVMQLGDDNILMEASDKHGEACTIMVASPVIANEEVES